MNTKTLIAAAAFALLGANVASAQEAVPATWANEITQQSVSSAKTRAQVSAELAAARATGELNTSADNYGPFAATPFVSTRTRAEVKSEIAAARASGALNASADNYGPFDAAPFVSTRTRAEVKAEVLHAIAAGQHLSQGDRTGG